jgi:3-isopropylmalate/(R)-2-methylmalate dehydratase large subunit
MSNLTMAEKILLAHTKQKKIEPGEIIEAAIDVAMSHEMMGSRVLPQLAKAGVKKIWDPSRVVMILDHWVPAPTVEAATIHQQVREFVSEFGIEHFYDVGRGICHQVLVEEGHIRPGELVVGTDSHTTTGGAFGALATGIGATDMAIVLATGRLWFRVPETIKITYSGDLPPMVMGKDIILHTLGELGVEGATFQALEYHGNTLTKLGLDAWMTLTNMAVEVGAMAALIPPDERVIKYVKTRTKQKFKPIKPDAKARYDQTFEFDVSTLTPQVATPSLPTQVVPVSEVAGTPIDQAYLGSCTNGRLEDLQMAAQILDGKQVANRVRFIVNPASREIYHAALEDGTIGSLVKAGATIGPVTCGACFGGHCGLLAPGEVCISSTNRNFPGRMGSAEAQIYLASPATVAASAITGTITNPRGGN